MSRPLLEVADVLRRFEGAYRQNHGGLSRDQARVVRALIQCRTAALGGHVDACDACGERQISYNSCRDRHCPKCQAAATAEWLERERAYLLPVPYSHVVFTLPHTLSSLALQNGRLCYGLLFQAAAQTLLEIAGDPKHLGAKIGFVAILHTWGQTLLHHPHLHCLVPAGGLAPDQTRWIACRNGFFLPVRVLGARFRAKYLALLEKANRAGTLRFHGPLQALAEPAAFARLLKEARRKKWVVYAKPPLGGPEPVLKYLARYTHRIAISNSRLTSLSEAALTFTWKDYREGKRQRPMRLAPCEFLRRFLLHALPSTAATEADSGAGREVRWRRGMREHRRREDGDLARTALPRVRTGEASHRRDPASSAGPVVPGAAATGAWMREQRRQRAAPGLHRSRPPGGAALWCDTEAVEACTVGPTGDSADHNPLSTLVTHRPRSRSKHPKPYFPPPP